MHVEHLSLTNFRNYRRLELPLPTGPTLLHGDNAQGKTNLLEALYYLATTRSPFTNTDSQIINWDASTSAEPVVVGRLVANVTTAHETRLLEMRLIQEQKGQGQISFRREALVNRRKVRLMDLLGHLQVVLFLPEDVELITGAPAARRRYLNITLCQTDRVYCRTLSEYNKVLEQRNALLRQLAEGMGNPDVLDIFTDRLVRLGSQLFARRAAFFAEISRETQRIHYEALTKGRESLRVTYAPRLEDESNLGRVNGTSSFADAEWLSAQQDNPVAIAERFAAALKGARKQDLGRGATTLGPHRDDWYFSVNGRNLADYGSRGQQRTGMLALKLAEIEWMASVTGEKPLLLLDEVVAELDEYRRELLLTYVSHAPQAILTATDPKMFSSAFLEQSSTFFISNGRVQPTTHQS